MTKRGAGIGALSEAEQLTDVYTVENFHDAIDVFRSPKFTVIVHDGTEEFRGGTLRMTDGDHHLRRRKVLGSLLRGDGDEWFRERVLIPTIERNVSGALAAASVSDTARADLVLIVRRSFFQLAASLIGLLDVDTPESAEELRARCEPINTAMRSWYIPGDRAAIMQRGIDARNEFRQRYFEPALRHHEELMRQVKDGVLDESQLPHDFLSIVASGQEADWSENHDQAVREAITDMINAGTFSSSFTLIHTVDQCFVWLDEHPDDRRRMTDPEWLYRMVRESLRLHPVVPYLFRYAKEDATLPSGRKVQAAELIRIHVRPANRDREVFGDDADEFNPMREVPKGVYPFGVAFGAGRHMCFGLPIIVGSNGENGSHVQMVRALYAAGIDRDQDNPPVWNTDNKSLALWETYPVAFRPELRP